MNPTVLSKHRLATAVLILASGFSLGGCSDDDDDTLTCDPPQVINDTGDACIDPEPTPPYAVDLFLKGEFSGWGAEEEYMLTFEQDAYYLHNVEMVAGVPQFKVADANWTLETTFTADVDNLTEVVPGESYVLQTGDGAANMAMVLEQSGIYDYKLEVGDDLLHPTFSFSQDVAPLDYDIYLRGGFNGWTTDNQLRYVGDNNYQMTMQITPGNHEFKVASADWSSEWVLDPDVSVVAELDTDYVMYPGGPNSSFFVTETGYYRFNVDASEPTALVLHITETDGDDGVIINPHEGHEVRQELSFTTFDDQQETVTFSAEVADAEFRSYAQSTTQDLRDPGDPYVLYEEVAGKPKSRTGNLAFDALFALSVHETAENSVSEIRDDSYNGGDPIPCDCFETGAKWHYVWTRDLSYAANLGLALLDPERVRNSLQFKLSGYRAGTAKPTAAAGDASGIQIVQDTGSGGSWPISTDRVTWALGAEKALNGLPATERAAFATQAYQALVNTVENDRIAAFDSDDGLYHGEQSFLDWREQTYASWIVNDIASLGSAKALSTNVAHYKALQLTAKLAQEQGDATASAKYQGWADALKIAINDGFWLADAGLYSSLTAGHQSTAPLHKFDWLGQALAVTSGIADAATAEMVVANYPHGDMGAPVIFPQQPDIAVYHNRAIWPFVTAYGLRAAIQTGNTKVADAAYTTLIRAASLNISNMENLEWLSLQPNLLDFDNPGLSGPVINSTRQLWSVGAYVGMVIEGVFGVSTTDTGIEINPFVTNNLHATMFADSTSLALQGLVLQGKTINLTLNLPALTDTEGSYSVATITLNGDAATQQLSWAELSESNDIVVTFGALTNTESSLTAVTAEPLSTNDPAVFAPLEPTISRVFVNTDNLLAVEFNDDSNQGNLAYHLYRNGMLIQENVAVGIVTDNIGVTAGQGYCYTIEAVYTDSGNRSHHNQPACYDAAQEISVANANVTSNLTVSPADDIIDESYLGDWGAMTDTLVVSNVAIANDGDYDIQLKYHNNYNAINLGITNGVKWLQVKDSDGAVVAEGVIQMPHALTSAGTKPLVYSTPLTATLTAGSYSLELMDFYNMSYLSSNETFTGNGGDNGPVNRFDIAAIRLQPAID
ncbi:esterase [Corallincola holothuriorum]|uniref:Esterase n=1 Tax=Corallincola holothuriorum TaxID=2282215 RepID=A0A368NQD9_9GAMM|nr:esterase [Corallincola holothuriorum]RCU51904.1 esterase [Corallincola holothuriorum]